MKKGLILTLIFLLLNVSFVSAWVFSNEKILTPYTADQEVTVISEQQYNKRSFAVRVTWDEGDMPFILTPSNETIHIDELSDFEYCLEENNGYCWFEYQFNEEGIYVLGNKAAFNTSDEEFEYSAVVKVEDNLKIKKINKNIRMIINALKNKFKHIFGK